MDHVNPVMKAIHDSQYVIWKWVAAGRISGAGQFPYYNYKHWAYLLGYANVQELVRHPNPDHVAIVEAIAGPNGFTVYKMLEAKRAQG